MFTVCPKCALTLVVTAQDLRVAQGYVRCGRCSNVFNAIVALTDDRGVPQSAPGAGGGAGASSPSTASTSIIRKAPSIADEPAVDPLEATGETEALYAEPDPENGFQEVFAEPAPPSSRPMPFDSSRPVGPVSFVAPPPGPPVKASTSPPPAPKKNDGEKRYSDTEGIDTYSENELEFNPDRTDLSKVFVEAAPVAFRNNAETGTFEKIVLGPNGTQASAPPKPAAPAPSSSPLAGAARAPSPVAPTPAAPAPPAPAPRPSASTIPPSRTAASAASSASAPAPKPPPTRQAPPPAARAPARDAEDQRIDNDLRSLAARVDSTASRPALKTPFAANDEALTANDAAGDDEEADVGDVYSRTKARARPLPPPPPKEADWAIPDEIRSELQSAGSSDIEAVGADSFAPAPPRRNRAMLWVAGSAVLSVLLAAQAVHHNRHDLATSALLNRPLTSFYNLINVSLVPNWDLQSYDVRQLGASMSDSGQGTLTVRASLKNGADQSRPLPLLRITMQDRYGNALITSDVSPKDYVPGAVPAGALLGAGQRVDAEMKFMDPGPNAVGFEIDACLPTASGRIACANDVPSAR